LAQDLPESQQNVSAKATRNWGDLRLRMASAAILAPIAFFCIWVGKTPWAMLIGLGTLGLAVEWVQLCKRPLLSWQGMAVMTLVMGACASALLGAPVYAVLLVVIGTAAMWALSGVLALGVIYVGLPCVALIWVRADPLAGQTNILLLILVVWATDIGAYLAGRLIGGAKLAPRISPGKTWSGAAGGLLAAILVGLSIAPRAALVAAGLSLVAQAGDLLESGIKRHFGVKDSGWLIPGHGGLLDRLDGVLAASLLAAALACGLGRGALIWL
jgi:phosphatidate cytidylyltransferase